MPEHPAVMNTESFLLRIEDDFNNNNNKGDSCSDILADSSGKQPASHQPTTLPSTSNGTLPIWTIHPLTMWTSVSQGATALNCFKANM